MYTKMLRDPMCVLRDPMCAVRKQLTCRWTSKENMLCLLHL
jgi:hypothetical protein